MLRDLCLSFLGAEMIFNDFKKRLIETGGNIPDSELEFTWFSKAVEKNDFETVKYICENYENKVKPACTRFIMDAVKSDVEIFKYLINFFDYNIHKQNEYLIRASCGYGRLEHAKYLISKNADVSAQSYYSLLWAAGNGYLNVVKYLIEELGLSKKNQASRRAIVRALSEAVNKRQLKVIDYLLKALPLEQLKYYLSNRQKHIITKVIERMDKDIFEMFENRGIVFSKRSYAVRRGLVDVNLYKGTHSEEAKANEFIHMLIERGLIDAD